MFNLKYLNRVNDGGNEQCVGRHTTQEIHSHFTYTLHIEPKGYFIQYF
jgi:hypothetical protein